MAHTTYDTHIEPIEHGALSPWLGGRSFDACRAEFDERGYIVFEGVLPPNTVSRCRAALAPHMRRVGRNNFEGERSNRVYALLAKEPQLFSELAAHPLSLAFAEAELGSSCLLSALLAINLHPGETVQPWHYDDSQIEVPRPRRAFGVSTFWSIDATTEHNGATEVVPGSHLWGDADDIGAPIKDMLSSGDLAHHDPQPRDDAVRVTMPSGSLMVAKGTLWHRGGANRSDASRLIVTPQYCPGWARQIENMMAAVPPAVAASLPKRVRELLGYSIHAAFMGYVDGVHPERALHLAP